MTITLQIGQYGNQLAPCFFQQLLEQAQTAPETDVAPFFRYSQKLERVIPRAVLVDMEPKVVQKCLQTPGLNYLTNQCVTRQSGAGNNWAHGYQRFGPSVLQQILDAVRHESEYSDKRLSFLTMSSLAGGTGSGLSSYLLEHLKSDYPKAAVVAQTVLPFERGEISTQNYNSALSLSKMLANADFVAPLANDDASTIYQKTFAAAQRSPSFGELNQIIAHGMALNLLNFRDFLHFSLQSPVFKLNNFRATPAAPAIAGRVINEEKNQIVTSKQTKINQLQQQQNVFQSKLFSALQRICLIATTGSVADSQLDYGATAEKSQLKYAGGYFQVYGKFVPAAKDVSGSELQRYRDAVKQLQNLCQNPRIFQLGDAAVTQRDNQISDLRGGQSCGAAANLNGLLLKRQIRVIVDNLTKQLAQRQFLHLYERYGVEFDDLLQSLQTIEQMIKDYEAL